MAERTITKALIAQEDLALGQGTTLQRRQGVDTEVTRIDLPWVVTSLLDLAALDTSKYSHCVLDVDGDMRAYKYDATSAEAADDYYYIDPAVGSGQWVFTTVDAAFIYGTFNGVTQSVEAQINRSTQPSYAALIAAHAAQAYADGDTVMLTDAGIAGQGTIVYSVGHGITSAAGDLVRLDNDYYWRRNDITTLTAGMFGATGSGDDYTAIQLGLDRIAELGGGTLWLDKLHPVSETLQVKSDNTYIKAVNTLVCGFSCGDSFSGDQLIDFSNQDGVSARAECGMEGVLFSFTGSTLSNCPKGVRYNYLIRNCFFRNLEFDGNWAGQTIFSDVIPWADRSENIDFSDINIRSQISTSYVKSAPRMALRYTNESTVKRCRFFGGHFGTVATWPDGRTNPLLELDNCQGINIDDQNFFAYILGTAIRVISSDSGSQVQNIVIKDNSFERVNHAADGSLDIVTFEGGSGGSERMQGPKVVSNRYNSIPHSTSGDRPALKFENTYYADVDDFFCDVEFGVNANNGTARIYGLIAQGVSSATTTNLVIQMKDRTLSLYDDDFPALSMLASSSIPRYNMNLATAGGSGTDTVGLRARTESGIAKAQLHFDGTGNTPFQCTDYAFTLGEWGTTGDPTGATNTNTLNNSIMVNTVDEAIMVKIAGVWKSVSLT